MKTMRNGYNLSLNYFTLQDQWSLLKQRAQAVRMREAIRARARREDVPSCMCWGTSLACHRRRSRTVPGGGHQGQENASIRFWGQRRDISDVI